MPARAGTAEVLFEGNFSKLNKQAAAATRPLGAKLASSTNQAVGPTSRLGKAADRSAGSLNRLDKASSRTHKGFRSIGKGAAYALGAGGFGGGLYALFDVTKKAVTEFKESERVSRQTAATLKSTGGAANVTARHIGKLSTAISKKTGIDDEAIASTENLLLTFTKVRNETGKGNKIFDQATKAVTDMSVALKQDGKSSAIQLGKALNDPVKGITSLQRVGVAFTASQKDQIKTLVDSGNQLKAQKIILREINTEFGGSAAKQNTGAKQLQVSLGNLAETVGAKLNPYLARGARSLNTFVNQMQSGKGKGGEFVRTLHSTADAIAPVVVGAGKVAVALGKFGAAHPQLTKVAAAIALSGVAINTIRTSKAVGGISTLLGSLRKLARTKAGESAANSITSALGGVPGRSEKALGRTRSVFKRVLGRSGTIGGTAAADGVTSAASTRLMASAGKGGKLATSFASAGRLAGRAFALAAVVIISGEIGKALEEGRGKLGKVTGTNFAGAPSDGVFPGLTKGVRKLFGLGNRKGGRVFRGGGTVPAMLSSGEMGIEPSGRAWMVPGGRVAADNVPAMVRPGTAILTASGQSMMAGGASLAQALARQAPHFAAGGKVHAGKYSSTSYGPPWGGIQGTGITRTGVNLKGGPHLYGVAVDPSQIALGSSLRIQPNPFGTRKPFRAFDTGGAIKGNRIDFYDWRGRGKQMGWGKRLVNVARAGSNSGTGPAGSNTPRKGSVTIPAGTTHPLLGNLLSPLVEDALLGGIEAGKAGTSRLPLLTSVLEGIAPESTDYATRKSFEVAAATPRKRGRRGGSGAAMPKGVGSWGGKPVAKWIIPYLKYGRRHGWKGGVSSGFRTFEEQQRIYNSGVRPAARPGTSNHEGSAFPRGAVDVTLAGQLDAALRGYPHRKLIYAGAKDPVHFSFPHGGSYRKGGIIRGRRPRRIRSPRRPNLASRIGALAGNPGNRRADLLTQGLAGAVRGRSTGALIKARDDIKRRIRLLARNGLTGPERIQTRRLRGALSLIDDELGRPIGRALGSSDAYQDIVTRSLGNLDNELIVGGVDPESEAGRQAKIGRTTSAIGSLTSRRTVLAGALSRAKATGNREAVGQVQTEINEVDDQILGLRADLTTLSKATQEQTDETERLRTMVELQTQKTQEANQRFGVSQRQFDVLRKAPFGGSFASGGVVPGPAGAPRVVVAHGGETISPAAGTRGAPAVHLHFAPGTEWLRNFVKVEVDRGTRSAARGRAPLPGRGGGGY